MSLSALATVEQQLIMHCLESSEIVQLARCSRSLLHVADAPFVFQHAEPVRRPFPALPPGSSTLIPAQPQLSMRHAPFIVHWKLPETGLSDGDAGPALEAAIDALIAFLEATHVGRFHGIDAEDNDSWISEMQWKRIFASPVVRQIRYLALPCLCRSYAVSAELIELLSRLPLLATLRVGESGRTKPSEPCALLKLCELPSLTSFANASYYRAWPQMAMQSVARCPRLQSLSVSLNNNSSRGIRLLFELEFSPSLSSLRRLCLECCSFRADSLEVLFRVLTLMGSLRELELARCGNVDLVCNELPSSVIVHPLPTIFRTLCIEPDLSFSQLDSPTPLPVVTMLKVMPSIRCVLRLRAVFSSPAPQVCLQIATRLRVLFAADEELVKLREAGRFRIDWQLPQISDPQRE